MAGQPPSRGQRRRRGAARSPLCPSARPHHLRACWRRVRRRAAALPRRRAARPGLPRARCTGRGHRAAPVRRAGDAPPIRHPGAHHRGRLDRPSWPGYRRAARRPHTHRQRRRLRLRADGDARERHQCGRAARRRHSDRRRGIDGLRHRRLHDVRAAGRRRRRPHPHGPILRRWPGLPRRPGALGRRWGTVPPETVGATP